MEPNQTPTEPEKIASNTINSLCDQSVATSESQKPSQSYTLNQTDIDYNLRIFIHDIMVEKAAVSYLQKYKQLLRKYRGINQKPLSPFQNLAQLPSPLPFPLSQKPTLDQQKQNKDWIDKNLKCDPLLEELDEDDQEEEDQSQQDYWTSSQELSIQSFLSDSEGENSDDQEENTKKVVCVLGEKDILLEGDQNCENCTVKQQENHDQGQSQEAILLESVQNNQIEKPLLSTFAINKSSQTSRQAKKLYNMKNQLNKKQNLNKKASQSKRVKKMNQQKSKLMKQLEKQNDSKSTRKLQKMIEKLEITQNIKKKELQAIKQSSQSQDEYGSEVSQYSQPDQQESEENPNFLHIQCLADQYGKDQFLKIPMKHQEINLHYRIKHKKLKTDPMQQQLDQNPPKKNIQFKIKMTYNAELAISQFKKLARLSQQDNSDLKQLIFK